MYRIKMTLLLDKYGSIKPEFTIYGCPRDVRISFGYSLKVNGVQITFKHERTVCLFFEAPYMLSETEADAIRESIGFIPFWNEVDGKRYYDPEADFKDTEELMSRRKKREKIQYMGVTIYKALYNEMRALSVCKSDVGDVYDNPDCFPPHLQPYINGALKELGRVYTVTYIPYIAVYEYLGMDHLFGKRYIINGDRLYNYNIIGRAKAGRLFDDDLYDMFAVTLYNHEVPYLSKDTCLMLTNNMIELFKLVELLGDITSGNKLSPFQTRVLQYLIKVRGSL
jgi:hypothetical protein